MHLSVYLLKVIVKILWNSYCGFGPWVLSHYGWDTSLWIKTETITSNTFSPMRNKLIYSCRIKIPASEFSELLESIFCLLLFVEAFSLQKVTEILEEVVVGWQEVRWIWWMRQNFVAQFIQLLKHWLCDVWSGIVMDPFCWPVLAAVFSASHQLAEHASQV